MRINSFEPVTFVDGPGRRTAVFLQGCPIECPGCQNRALWSKTGGNELDVADVARRLGLAAAETSGNVTISGGEPFAQPLQLAVLVALLKQAYKVNHILVYSGYTIEQLCQPTHPAYPFLPQIFSYIDVLVDGPFIFALDDPFLSHRGSRNQRAIDIPGTLAAVAAGGDLALLDWDRPIEIVISSSGDVFMPVGLAAELAPALGTSQPQRRCGER